MELMNMLLVIQKWEDVIHFYDKLNLNADKNCFKETHKNYCPNETKVGRIKHSEIRCYINILFVGHVFKRGEIDFYCLNETV